MYLMPLKRTLKRGYNNRVYVMCILPQVRERENETVEIDAGGQADLCPAPGITQAARAGFLRHP